MVENRNFLGIFWMKMIGRKVNGMQMLGSITIFVVILMLHPVAKAQEVLAQVGAEKVTLADIQQNYANLPASVRQQASFEQARGQLIQQAVVQKLFALEARAKGFDKKPEVKQAFKQAQDSILHQYFVQDFAKNSRDDALIAKEYNEFKKNYSSGTEYKARHILVKTEKEAQDLIAKLGKGADFSELAKTYSVGPSASKGGDLGYFREGAMVKSFENAVKLLDSGKYTKKPIETKFGWHIIILDDKRQAQAPPLEQVKVQIEKQIADNKLQAYLQTLEKKYKVSIK